MISIDNWWFVGCCVRMPKHESVRKNNMGSGKQMVSMTHASSSIAPFPASHVGLPECTMEAAKVPLILCQFGSCDIKLFLTPPAMHWFGIETLDTNEYTLHYNNQSGIATAQSNNIQHISHIAKKTALMEPAISGGGKCIIVI